MLKNRCWKKIDFEKTVLEKRSILGNRFWKKDRFGKIDFGKEERVWKFDFGKRSILGNRFLEKKIDFGKPNLEKGSIVGNRFFGWKKRSISKHRILKKRSILEETSPQ